MLIDDFGIPRKEIDIPWHKEGINAIIRVLLRHGLDIQFKVNNGGHVRHSFSGKPSKTIYCNIGRAGDFFAVLNVDISADSVYVYAESHGRDKKFSKIWVKKREFRDWDYMTGRKIMRVKTRSRRPKFRKFAAYFIKNLLQFDGERGVERVMES